MIGLKVEVQPGGLALDKRQLRAAMRAIGQEVAARARQIGSGSGTGRLYYGPGGSAAKYRGGYVKGRYMASAPGQGPARVTGSLIRSIFVVPFANGEGVVIRSSKFYDLFLEKGAKGGGRRFSAATGSRVYRRGAGATGKSRVLLPRPLLTQAVADRAPTIGPRLREALLSGLKFERQRFPARVRK